ncbi:hypothetical protein EJ06DRAFT_86088 [Trichodelitschia bisporula]|uniref:Uncharacterized protein n=1 Tax=Trichodelitschia bisporula TaxID=703511 RepID=A0A6G1HS25_9PEZI|nr:hypothetical protein EJ06DRAFT_86088 [Trichodelitschia bisporula]
MNSTASSNLSGFVIPPHNPSPSAVPPLNPSAAASTGPSAATSTAPPSLAFTGPSAGGACTPLGKQSIVPWYLLGPPRPLQLSQTLEPDGRVIGLEQGRPIAILGTATVAERLAILEGDDGYVFPPGERIKKLQRLLEGPEFQAQATNIRAVIEMYEKGGVEVAREASSAGPQALWIENISAVQGAQVNTAMYPGNGVMPTATI